MAVIVIKEKLNKLSVNITASIQAETAWSRKQNRDPGVRVSGFSHLLTM